jgi:hypothetical protein
MLESCTPEESIQMPVERMASLMIRESDDGDRAVLERAEPDETSLPRGGFVPAGDDVEPVAAAALSSDNDFSGDPFRQSDTSDVQFRPEAIRPIQERWSS